MQIRALLALALTLPLAAQASLDTVVERCRKAFDVPGVAVAVVKDGRVVVAKGYGVRKLGDPAPVTPRTRFCIASNSKVFTAAALAQLVDEGKLAWDDRVVDRLPGFQMSDPYVTREMRIQDLLCHRSGLALGAGDLMFFPPSDLSEADILYRLRFVPLESSFRSAYAYDNILYNAAGALLKAVGGKPWAQVMRERFFAPLGMRDALASIRDLRPGDEVAVPHAMEGGHLVPLAFQAVDNNAPAASVVASLEDMVQWVKVLLAEGELGGGQRLLSAAQVARLQTPLTLLPPRKKEGPLKEGVPTMAAYALGLGVMDYRGERRVGHTGGLSGMVTQVTLLPDRHLGVIVLTNAESSEAFSAITNTLLDDDLKAPPKDWVAAYVEAREGRHTKTAEALAKAATTRDRTSRPSLPLAAYAGRYRDPWYGDVVIEAKGDHLQVRFSHTPALVAPLEHWQQDTFIARWQDRTLDADAYLTFSLDPEGKVASLAMRAVSPATDFSYDFHHLRLVPVAPATPPF